MFDFRLTASEGTARAGTLELPHGVVPTPAFMPVGTHGTVRALSPDDLEAIGAQIVLSNTYHLHLRPGEDAVEAFGGLHGFMAWKHPLLTDSGGFQIFSLDGFRRVNDEGVEFRSHIDGQRLLLTPERIVEIQWTLGADVAMAFDHVIPGSAQRSEAEDALERTTHWLERCLRCHTELAANEPERQTLWPIVQGATFPDLRRRAIEQISDLLDYSGVAIGGLAVGESKEVMYSILESIEPYLPDNRPRYLMGVGFPEDMLRSIARGMDLFDCVAPTRNGRNGTAYTKDGPLNIRNSAHRKATAPLEQDCTCETCRKHSRGYLRHLFVAEELLGLRLLSLHNVRFLIQLTAEARLQIMAGRFESWSRDWLARYHARRRM